MAARQALKIARAGRPVFPSAWLQGSAAVPTCRHLSQHHVLQQKESAPFNVPKKRTAGEYDVAVIGGGAVGMAIAREVRERYPGKLVAVLEKEAEVRTVLLPLPVAHRYPCPALPSPTPAASTHTRAHERINRPCCFISQTCLHTAVNILSFYN